jgi:hypothetical protein
MLTGLIAGLAVATPGLTASRFARPNRVGARLWLASATTAERVRGTVGVR